MVQNYCKCFGVANILTIYKAYRNSSLGQEYMVRPLQRRKHLALAFKTPTAGGSTLVVSTSGTATLKSGVMVGDGIECSSGMGNIAI